MLKKLLQNLLRKTGKTYTIDPDIPDALIVRTFYLRIIMLLRGIIKTGRKVYVGSNCKIFNKNNFKFGKNVTIESNTILDGYARNRIVLGDCVKIGAYSKLLSTSHLATFGKGMTMGNNSAVGDFTHFGAPGGITIGNDVIMGSYVSFHSENHNYSDTSKLIREQGVSSKGIIIGNNVWVGAKVTFLDGCVIGNNSVVAAGAVVNAVFPDNCVIGGVPAKIIKMISE
jgi:acetyltransferase-like isoleucine patch superfamily enzyme